jgi:hypothetical protein
VKEEQEKVCFGRFYVEKNFLFFFRICRTNKIKRV